MCSRAMRRAIESLPGPEKHATALASRMRRAAFTVSNSGSPGPTPTAHRIPVTARTHSPEH